MSEIELTVEEEKAIVRLKRLAKTWPKTLVLFGMGALSVRKKAPDGSYFIEREVDRIWGIHSDGGDGGD